MTAETDSIKQAHTTQDTGPHTLGEAWIHSINPIDLFKDANQSSKSWAPLGLGFDAAHPIALASPEFLELAVLDPLFRVGKATWDVGVMTPFNELRDAGSALKDVVNVAKDIIDAPIDLLSMHPSDAWDDVKNIFKDGYQALKHTADALVIDPVQGLWKGVMDIL
jgi:hypothetical protein